MEAKKNPRADLNSQRPKFFLIGLMVSLSLVITAFEWQTQKSKVVSRQFDLPMEPLAIIPATQFEQPKVVAPPSTVPIKKQLVLNPSPIQFTTSDDDYQESPTVNLEPSPVNSVVYVEPEIDSSTYIFIIAEKNPTPIGGLENFYRIVSQNLKYPAQARRLGIEGKVFVDFVIDRMGNPTNIKVSRGIGAGCDEEAMRVVAIPKWQAGKQRGRPVNVRMSLAINFKLNQ